MQNIIVIVLVLYKENLSKTPSYLLIKQILQTKNNFYLLVYDNSPEKQMDDLFNFVNVRYIHDKENMGLAEAYNEGINYLHDVSGDFLLLLDQDTTLEKEYLEQAADLECEPSIGAYVPIVFSGERQISPVCSENYVGLDSPKPEIGRAEKRIMAINSGTILPEKTLSILPKFNTDFPLDFLDHWLFWTIYQNKLQVRVLNYQVSHDLSVLSHEFVSLERYSKILEAETRFYQHYDVQQFRRHKKQLLLRTLKQFLLQKKRLIWKRTWQEFYRVMRGK